ncbi:hypothetical protein BDDG_12459 [Blastomyces dermatitidis ATCC 18188]|uniref:Uncharacterized protein n=1 Tax=Ajellomyces dermatitidis (strain ATCC 18188 / CBS 674.68) TaxID=653446 RepID=A0A0J9ENU8_AJEDA|nr:hypothetical protein BDDG_12459 [Blastomyces dermatitidis ATCC 18188]
MSTTGITLSRSSWNQIAYQIEAIENQRPQHSMNNEDVTLRETEGAMDDKVRKFTGFHRFLIYTACYLSALCMDSTLLWQQTFKKELSRPSTITNNSPGLALVSLSDRQ